MGHVLVSVVQCTGSVSSACWGRSAQEYASDFARSYLESDVREVTWVVLLCRRSPSVFAFFFAELSPVDFCTSSRGASASIVALHGHQTRQPEPPTVALHSSPDRQLLTRFSGKFKDKSSMSAPAAMLRGRCAAGAKTLLSRTTAHRAQAAPCIASAGRSSLAQSRPMFAVALSRSQARCFANVSSKGSTAGNRKRGRRAVASTAEEKAFTKQCFDYFDDNKDGVIQIGEVLKSYSTPSGDSSGKPSTTDVVAAFYKDAFGADCTPEALKKSGREDVLDAMDLIGAVRDHTCRMTEGNFIAEDEFVRWAMGIRDLHTKGP